MIKTIGTGRLTRDAEVKDTQSGKQICKFSVACDTGWADNKRTEFVNCVKFGNNLHKLGMALEKGMKVYFEGTPKTNDYTTKDGEKRRSVDVIVSELDFFSSKQTGKNTGRDSQTQQKSTRIEDIPDEEIPF